MVEKVYKPVSNKRDICTVRTDGIWYKILCNKPKIISLHWVIKVANKSIHGFRMVCKVCTHTATNISPSVPLKEIFSWHHYKILFASLLCCNLTTTVQYTYYAVSIQCALNRAVVYSLFVWFCEGFLMSAFVSISPQSVTGRKRKMTTKRIQMKTNPLKCLPEKVTPDKRKGKEELIESSYQGCVC